MAATEQDSLAQSLSEEESDQLIRDAKSKKKQPSSPTLRGRQVQGYKFSAEQQKLTSNDFDFATQSKNGTNHSSSEEGEETDSFVDLSHEVGAEVANGGDVGVKSSSATAAVPTTPTKFTPHKRTAELAETGEVGVTGANGSPPSSPAPKKKKHWNDYLAEDDAKRGIKPEESSEKKRFSKGILLAILVAILAIIAGVYVAYCPKVLGFSSTPKPTANVATWKKAHKSFFRGIQTMKESFPKQNKETWIQLIAAIGSTLEESEPAHPAAITVLLPPGLPEKFSTCFLNKVATKLNAVVAPVIQNVTGKKSAIPADPKILSPAMFQSTSISAIRADVESYLKTQGKAVITQNIDKFTKEVDLLMFHGLCDNFHAIDKRATILFPVRIPQSVFEKYEWKHERGGDISIDYLNTAFQRVVSADTGPALVARIADAVILLNEGDNCV